MEKVECSNEILICEFDGVTECAVYVGGMSNLKKVNDKMRWRYDARISRECFDPAKVLTLDEIAAQLSEESRIITVITNGPLHGVIYQYGNYGNEWWLIGKTWGYA